MTQEISENYGKVHSQAIKYLGLRAHTVFELRTKLMRKKFDKRDVEEVLEDLLDRKYLDDADFARMFAQNLIKYRSFGYYGIKMKLKMRGIDGKLAEDILSEELDMDSEKKIALRALGKSRTKTGMALAAMLNRKGFRSQVISSMVGDYSDE